MLDLTLRKILDCLSEDAFVSMDVLCKQTHRSEKTIRKLLSELGGMLEENGAKLVKKYGKGIRIVVFDRAAYQKFLSDSEQVFSCNTSEERIRYILYVLLFGNEFIKIEDLCEKLFASRKTISTDLRQIDEYLDGYCLVLDRKPYHGLRITGQELRFRQCMLEYLMGLQREGDWIRSQCFADEDVIRQCVMDKLNQYGYLLYESELRTIILQIQIALYRLQNGHGMTIEEMDYNSGLKEIDIDTANVCARSLQGINPAYVFDIPEIKYLAILISGKKRQQASYPDNIVIDMEINQLVNDMLASVIKVFNVDLYEDFELQTILRKHMFALRIRLQYHMQLKNPMLKEIKETYSFPYAMAAQACTILAEYFHTIVSEDEIGYIAMCIALSIERKKKTTNRRNIVLVCESGTGSAKLFQYRFEEAFKDYLNRVEVCDVHSLPDKDLSEVDYIFSTVPIQFNVPVPIYQVQYFFDSRSAGRLKKLLKNCNAQSILRYFREELFFTDIPGTTKEEVLHQLCVRIAEQAEVPDTFEEYVMRREQIMQTDFGNCVAIPHPYAPITQETFVSVAVLSKPIHWFTHDVQVVFLLSISVNKENLEDFYNISPMFMLDEEFVQTLIREKSYEVLISAIKKIEDDYEWRT